MKNILKVAALFLIVLTNFTIAINPALAQTISSNLEAQVLQIIKKNPKTILESIEDYQQSQHIQKQQAQLKLLQEIKSNPYATVANSPIQGVVNSKLLLIEFSDFQCPYCAEAHETLKQFVRDHKDQVALIYKHYPLAQIHSEAMSAATASWAAQQQKKFWQYHDFLFTHQNQLRESLYLQGAKELGLNIEQFERDRQSQAALKAVRQDTKLAEKLGISGTPFFVMDLETVSGAVPKSFLEDKLAQMQFAAT